MGKDHASPIRGECGQLQGTMYCPRNKCGSKQHEELTHSVLTARYALFGVPSRTVEAFVRVVSSGTHPLCLPLEALINSNDFTTVSEIARRDWIDEDLRVEKGGKEPCHVPH